MVTIAARTKNIPAFNEVSVISSKPVSRPDDFVITRIYCMYTVRVKRSGRVVERRRSDLL